MVDHEGQRARYLGGTDGAPPVPPPGGYRAGRRSSTAHSMTPTGVAPASTQQTPGDPFAGLLEEASATKAATPTNAFGWIAMLGSILFALILIGLLIAGGTDMLYDVTMVTCQLALVAVIIAALFTTAGRRMGTIGLVITLMLNVATVGGLSAIQSSASGNYDGQKTDKQKHQEAFPGIKDVDSGAILMQSSLEQARAKADAVSADIRAALTEEFGYTWTIASEEYHRPERNGYGGESMLSQFGSVTWATNEPIQDYRRKLEIITVIDGVLAEHDMWELWLLSDPASGIDLTLIEKIFGSTDPRTQHSWQAYSSLYPEPLTMYANFFDLSKDATGDFRREREAQSARTGEPLEGLQLYFSGYRLLSEADRAEFEERLQQYPGF